MFLTYDQIQKALDAGQGLGLNGLGKEQKYCVECRSEFDASHKYCPYCHSLNIKPMGGSDAPSS